MIEGACVMTTNFPENYISGEGCKVILRGIVNMNVDSFLTEEFFDALIINGTEYSGSQGPPSGNNVFNMIWSTDPEQGTNRGWKICGLNLGEDTTSAGPTTTFTARQSTTTAPLATTTTYVEPSFSVQGTGCFKQDLCVLSANHPEKYGTNEA